MGTSSHPPTRPTTRRRCARFPLRMGCVLPHIPVAAGAYISVSVVRRLTGRCGGSLGAWQLRMEAARFLCWTASFHHSIGGFGALLRMAANVVRLMSSVLLYVSPRGCLEWEEGRHSISRVTAFQHRAAFCQRLLRRCRRWLKQVMGVSQINSVAY
jgi:hypothetical protein